MKKYFCDLCESELGRDFSDHRAEIELDEKVLIDKSARVTARIAFSFVKHSSGYGGPPDLCKGCRKRIIMQLHNSIG